MSGLCCAAYLGRAGLKTLLLEARGQCGAHGDTTEPGIPGFLHKLHTTWMITAISLAMGELEQDRFGLEFVTSDIVYGKIFFSPADGDSYRRMYSDFKEFSEKILIPCTYVPAVPPVDQVRTLLMAKDDVGRRFNEVADHTPLQILESYGFREPVKAGILNLFAMWGL